MPWDTNLTRLDDDDECQRGPSDPKDDRDDHSDKGIPDTADKPMTGILIKPKIRIPDVQFDMFFLKDSADISNQQEANKDHEAEHADSHDVRVLDKNPVGDQIQH